MAENNIVPPKPEPPPAAPSNKHRKYTEEEKLFIADTSNSLQEIADRFGYKNKAVATKMRSYFKARARSEGSESV